MKRRRQKHIKQSNYIESKEIPLTKLRARLGIDYGRIVVCDKERAGCGLSFPSKKQFMDHFETSEGHILGKIKKLEQPPSE